ncbi:MAG: ABC transporter ATP-binding protein, partial [Mycobacteriales bacterium]
MIEAAGLRREFRLRGRPPVVAVADLTFAIAPGEFVGYAGPNGAGKSTTIKMLTGILTPTAGQIRVAGLTPGRDRRRLARKISVVFGQRSGLWWELPLTESLDLLVRIYRLAPAAVRERRDQLVEALGLADLLDRPVRTLSLGQRMRAELAAAVLPSPQVLFLDEPTIGLDLEAKAAVRTFLAEENRSAGTTVVLTTHDLDDITALCSRLIIIDHGRLVYDGTVPGLRAAYTTERVLVVDLVVDLVAPVGHLEVPGTREIRSEGARHWLAFPRSAAAPDIIGRVLASYDVADLTLEEPDL